MDSPVLYAASTVLFGVALGVALSVVASGFGVAVAVLADAFGTSLSPSGSSPQAVSPASPLPSFPQEY